MNISEMYGLGESYRLPGPVLFGVECEIESVNADISWNLPSTIDVIRDNSLRNNGYEFLISPQKIDRSVELFRILHERLAVYNRDQRFSERTSTHVHVNCKNLDEVQVRQIILLYALFEEVFFLFTKQKRRNNIHCVALGDTIVTKYYGRSLSSMVEHWHKYTALNIRPLTRLGTIEFRHMHGHDDVFLHTTWLSVLENLFLVGSKVDVLKADLTENNLKEWAEALFAGTDVYEGVKDNLLFWTKDSVLDLKLVKV